VEAFYVTPRLVLDSAEPGSGKTRVLELLNLLCLDPEMTISASTAALFRLIHVHPITVLFDEVDAIFNPKTAGNSEDLRALLNAGYKRGATIARCVGDAKAMSVTRYPVFSPVALAGIAGSMPSTITTRAITVHMRRRGPGETVAAFRERHAEAEAGPIRGRLASWVRAEAHALAVAEPVMPAGVTDRPAEVWEALLAIADAAGGHWPDTARAACVHFVTGAAATPPTLGGRLLVDLRTLYAGRDRMATVDILDALLALDESPWGDLYGKPLDARRLARELTRYGVTPTRFKDDENRPTAGYTTYATTGNEGLADAWSRYLPPIEAAGCGNCGNCRNCAAQTGYRTETLPVTAVTRSSNQGQVTDVSVTRPTSVTTLTRAVTEVTAVTGNPRPLEGVAA
jgi:hypothetical protein